ncbi:MAG: multicopper oxidase domain-containing protein [Deltaproteobacteria bacterium]|nr:multicopper oxidase domain-containing protein [Deltaproteobacteria bacterium]
MLRLRTTAVAGLIFFILFAHMQAQAATVEYKLNIAQNEVNITGKSARGMTINGTIPGPTLRFKEGDFARIHVHNKMSVETSIHWHGVLVPPDMDGVPNVSFPPIKPDTTYTYEFPIRQSGTYWYHSHTSLQEQSGVYGSIVIEPRQNGPKPDHDYVILFSDWTDENPHEVNRTLKRGSEWYAIQKGSGQSIIGAARLGMLGDYFRRELQRMPAMDVADVAYDRFLANGEPESTLPAEPNETVRLRIIDGSATTYFHLEFAGGPMTIVAADGLDVQPVKENRFLIGVAETYDVLIQVPASGAYEFRATAHDGSGYASAWIGSGERHPAPEMPKPNLYHTMGDVSLKQVFSLTPAGTMGMSDREVEAGKFDQPGMMGMGSMDMGAMPGMESMDHGAVPSKMKMDGTDDPSSANAGDTSHDTGMPMEHPRSSTEGMDHDGHPMPMPPQASRIGKKYGTDFRFLAADVSASKNLAVDGMDPSRPWPPYAKLRAIKPTAFSKDKPAREIRLTLDGDMERYVWFLNNKPLSESDSIRIREGEVARFIMINRTMMHHPMHLHGHFFRVINGQGDYAPLKHTVDVAPMSTTVIEFDANEFGDWFFHCHLLYHMKSGMARVVHYEGFTLDPQLAAVRPDLYKDSWYFWGQADALSNMTEGFLMLSNTRNILTAEWEVGWQEVDDTEWEGIFTYDRYINRFFTIFAGANLLGEGDEHDDTRGVLGFRYLLPLNLESRAWIDTDGGARFNLGKSFELTPRLALLGEAQYDTHDNWEGSAGLSYMVHKYFSLVGQWHSEYGFGGGLQIRF